MAASLKQRIVRTSLRTVVVFVLLPLIVLIWYIAAWLLVSRATHQGTLSGVAAAQMAPVFTPLRYYSGSEWLGSYQLNHVWWATTQVSLDPGLTISPAMNLAPCKEDGLWIRHNLR